MSGKDCGFVEKLGRWPCSVCGKGVGRNSIQCTSCMSWVHKRCSGSTLSLQSVKDVFVCKVCQGVCGNRSDSVGEELSLGNGDSVECVDRFCYLGDMLNGGGGAESASVTRIRCAWAKFRELSGLLTKKEVSLRMKGRVYTVCVRSAMLYGSETWAINSEQVARVDRTEMRMVRWMCGVSLRERCTNMELREKLGIESVSDVLRRRRLRWFGHVLRKEDEDWVKKCMDLEVDGNRRRGRPRRRWRDVVMRDMEDCGLVKEDAFDRAKWRMLSWGDQLTPA